MNPEPIALDEVIHQSTRLRIMTLLSHRSRTDKVAYPLIQKTLGLTGGNLTVHLRKLEEAGYVAHDQGVCGCQASHLGRGHICRPTRLR